MPEKELFPQIDPWRDQRSVVKRHIEYRHQPTLEEFRKKMEQAEETAQQRRREIPNP